MTDDTGLKDAIRDKYGAAARAVRDEAAPDESGCDCGCGSPVTRDLYGADEVAAVPAAAAQASLGCGNPTALATLEPGETVLDLGSGGGIDVLLSAQRVGPTGMVYGLDMTDDMLELARENQKKAGVTNVEFLKGDIEDIPLPDESVDVIISNCVVNLAADKRRVLAEAFRVLRPGGRLAISDIVVQGPVPDDVRRSVELWIGCVAGALDAREFESLIKLAGFVEASIEPTRVYRREDTEKLMQGGGPELESIIEQVDGRFMSAFVRAIKPSRSVTTDESRVG